MAGVDGGVRAGGVLLGLLLPHPAAQTRNLAHRRDFFGGLHDMLCAKPATDV